MKLTLPLFFTLAVLMAGCGESALSQAALDAASEDLCSDVATQVRADLRGLALAKCAERPDAETCSAKVHETTDGVELAIQIYCQSDENRGPSIGPAPVVTDGGAS